MRLKETDATNVFITNGGRIGLSQPQSKNVIYLTIEQFKKIQNWVDENTEQIYQHWDEGICWDEDIYKDGDDNNEN